MRTQTDTEDIAVASYLFHEGTNAHAFAYLGVTKAEDHFRFRVFAPHADEVSVCGDFNNWDPNADRMTRQSFGGVWEIFLPAWRIRAGQYYKYCIRRGGQTFLKADPFATVTQIPPDTASVICDPVCYRWRDEGWMRYRKCRFDRAHIANQPFHVYGICAGAWKQKENGLPYSYAELAVELAPYLKQMGYTHVEFMPPLDDLLHDAHSFYAPAARYGSPEELMQFVDAMHEAGIGVLLHWDCLQIPKSAGELLAFDGEALYELADSHEAGTRFDFGRAEVQSFLLSSAVFWVERFHIDGLCICVGGGEEPSVSVASTAFFQKLNAYLCKHFPDVVTVAELSDPSQKIATFVCKDPGFSLCGNYEQVFDLVAPNEHDERILLTAPRGVDESVEATLPKGAIGADETKFARIRACLTHMMTYPGKKRTLMGCELGTPYAGEYARLSERLLTDSEMRCRLQLFTARLNRFYLMHPALWKNDANSFQSFTSHAAQGIFSYQRVADGEELTVILHFSMTPRKDYLQVVSHAGVYEELLTTDAALFGGGGIQNQGELYSVPHSDSALAHAVRLTLPPMSAIILHRVR